MLHVSSINFMVPLLGLSSRMNDSKMFYHYRPSIVYYLLRISILCMENNTCSARPNFLFHLKGLFSILNNVFDVLFSSGFSVLAFSSGIMSWCTLLAKGFTRSDLTDSILRPNNVFRYLPIKPSIQIDSASIYVSEVTIDWVIKPKWMNYKINAYIAYSLLKSF